MRRFLLSANMSHTAFQKVKTAHQKYQVQKIAQLRFVSRSRLVFEIGHPKESYEVWLPPTFVRLHHVMTLVQRVQFRRPSLTVCLTLWNTVILLTSPISSVEQAQNCHRWRQHVNCWLWTLRRPSVPVLFIFSNVAILLVSFIDCL